MIQTNFLSLFTFFKHRPPGKNNPALDCHLLVRGAAPGLAAGFWAVCIYLFIYNYLEVNN